MDYLVCYRLTRTSTGATERLTDLLSRQYCSAALCTLSVRIQHVDLTARIASDSPLRGRTLPSLSSTSIDKGTEVMARYYCLPAASLLTCHHFANNEECIASWLCVIVNAVFIVQLWRTIHDSSA
eukprot:scaffold341995_cov42-Prasinocladus_malaysianus.AAC.2